MSQLQTRSRLNRTSHRNSVRIRSSSLANPIGDLERKCVINPNGHSTSGQSFVDTSCTSCPALVTPCASRFKYASAPPVGEYPRRTKTMLSFLLICLLSFRTRPIRLPLLARGLYTPHVRQNSCKPMPGETLNAPPPLRSASSTERTLPRHLLYSIFARIGGSGLDTDAFETLRASFRGGFLGKAIAYDNRQKEIPASLIHSLRWHPVRLISFLDRPYYYGAKKKYVDWIASRHLATGRYDLFHSWSGDCLLSLRVAKKHRIPSHAEIPTWHRDGGKNKVERRKTADSASTSRGLERWKARLLLERKRFIEEYQLADLLLVLSERAANTFRVRGFPEEKLFYLPRGVDVERFKPGNRPQKFRAVFAGALIRRKG